MRIPVLISIILILSACKHSELDFPEDKPIVLDLPPGFPAPDIPADNFLTEKRVELGKLLFYDPALSVDSTVSCATCHEAKAGFADHLAVSQGVKGRTGFRNSPTLTNVAYHPWFFKEGGSPTLELQALGPIENKAEMGFNAVLLAERLKGHPVYTPLAQQAYDREMDLYVLVRSIAAFERTLISGNSPFDKYHFQGKENALNEQEKKGMELFYSERTGCSQCHSDFDFSDYSFRNNGLYVEYADRGRQRVTLLDEDIGKFKVPTLRNIALTAPYMHDGSLATLSEVIDHYQAGGKNHPSQSPLITGFSLSEEEKANLLSFLEALTDDEFINNPAFQP